MGIGVAANEFAAAVLADEDGWAVLAEMGLAVPVHADPITIIGSSMATPAGRFFDLIYAIFQMLDPKLYVPSNFEQGLIDSCPILDS